MIARQPECENKMSVENSNVAELQGNDATTVILKAENNDAIMENATSQKGQDGIELMDVDDEESLSAFQQDDEPMEQEAAHTSDS